MGIAAAMRESVLPAAVFFAVELNGYPLPIRLEAHIDKSERAAEIARLIFKSAPLGVRVGRAYALVINYERGPGDFDDEARVQLKAARGVAAAIPVTELDSWVCAECDDPLPPSSRRLDDCGRHVCDSCYRADE